MSNRTAHEREMWLHNMRIALADANVRVKREADRIIAEHRANPKPPYSEQRSDVQRDYDEDRETSGGPGA